MLHQPRGVRAAGTQAGSLGGQEGAPEPERRGVGEVMLWLAWGVGCVRQLCRLVTEQP